MHTTTAKTTVHHHRQADPDTVVSVRDLHVRFGDFAAVDGIDLTVRRGELFALLGTNGAGKTTTLETLEGLRAPTSGTVSVLGADPAHARRSLAERVGVMLQASGCPEDLRPAEVLRLWGRLHPARPEIDVDAALEQVQLGHRRDVACRHLSGGERRRLDLALAIFGDPDLLFLDEPTTGMDPEARARTWSLIRDLLRRGTTVLLTTHYLEEAEALADRLAIMHTGGIAVHGSLDEVLATQPARISFRIPGGLSPGDLPAMAGTVEFPDTKGTTSVEIISPRLQSDLAVLLRWAEARDVELAGLSATEASLSHIFHHVQTEQTR